MVESAVAEVAEANRKAAEETRQMWANVGTSIKSSMEGTIDGIIDGANDLGDVLDDVLKTLAKMAIKSAILGPLGAGGLGIPGFANGGMHKGGWAMVGEQGPELINTGPGRIYNNRDTRRMMGGGLDLNITVGGNRDDIRNQIVAEINSRASEIAELAVAKVTQNAGRPSPTNSAIRGAR